MEDFRGEGMVDEYLKYMRSCSYMYARLFISKRK